MVQQPRPTSVSYSTAKVRFYEIAEVSHSLGLFPVIRKNSRLKLDFVLKPEESIADVTFSPCVNAVCAVAMRAEFT
jgi:hypothetical protein